MNSIYYPSYYNEFSCIADKCSDSCCAKWEIVIDDETFNKYSSLNSSFGEIIRSNIDESEEGERYFRLVKGRCPFLNDCGLCDIHINLGEDFTSTVCRQHPRFIEEYDGFTEISLSLSCPEAMRLIFLQKKDMKQYPSPVYNGEDDALAVLISSREKILSVNDDYCLIKKTVLDTAADDILDLDAVYVEDHPVFSITFIKSYLEVLLNECEILTDEWKLLLKTALEAQLTENELDSFMAANNDNICKAIKYFTYRYYLKAVNDLDTYSRALLIILSATASSYIALVCKIPFEEAVRLYSKEIEHSTVNVDMILDYLCKI